MLLEQLVQKTGITKYHLLDGDGDAAEVVRRVGKDLAPRRSILHFWALARMGILPSTILRLILKPRSRI